MALDTLSFPSFRSSFLVRALLGSVALLPAVAFTACSTTTTTEPSCEGYLNEEPPAAATMTWRFVNATNLPIFLAPAQGCSSVGAAYQLTGPEGGVKTESDVCGGSCEMLQEHGDVACAADCAVPPIRALPPGTSWEHVWDGSEWASRDMPDACVESDGAFADARDARPATARAESVDCLQRVAAADGAYELSLEAYTACVSGDELCTCDSTDADGTCRVSEAFSSEVQGKKLSAKTSFTMPSPGVVEVRFEGELCRPSSTTTPCAAYGNDGCCQGETCSADAMGELRCVAAAAP